jgi:hypothetical protein
VIAPDWTEGSDLGFKRPPLLQPMPEEQAEVEPADAGASESTDTPPPAPEEPKK